MRDKINVNDNKIYDCATPFSLTVIDFLFFFSLLISNEQLINQSMASCSQAQISDTFCH